MSNEERITVSRNDLAMASILDAHITAEERATGAALSAERLGAMRKHHVRLYTNRLHMASQGIRGVNVEETERLLTLWREMEGKTFAEMSNDQQLEVLDALVAGE